MINPIFHEYSTFSDVSRGLAKFIKSLIAQKPEDKDTTALFLSGGSTPIKLYETLYELFDESEVTLFQIDERWVKDSSERSNQRMISSIFRDKFMFLRMDTPENKKNINDSVKEYEGVLTKIFEGQVFTIGIFGMGEDGHTASLFPDVYNPVNLTNEFVKEYFVPSQNEMRISLTPKTFQKMDVIILLLNGENKGKTLSKAIKAQNELIYPVVTLFEHKCHIFLDSLCYSAYHGS